MAADTNPDGKPPANAAPPRKATNPIGKARKTKTSAMIAPSRHSAPPPGASQRRTIRPMPRPKPGGVLMASAISASMPHRENCTSASRAARDRSKSNRSAW